MCLNYLTSKVNLIRLAIFFLIIFIVSPLAAHAGNRKGFVCGKFHQNVMEVPIEYIYMFAEYEGAIYWDPDFINNKKGCDANFRVLPLLVSWPDMQASEYWERDDGLTIAITPIEVNEPYMTRIHNNFMNSIHHGAQGELLYDDESDLYFTEFISMLNNGAVKLLKHKNDPHYDDERRIGVYWDNIEGEVTTVSRCQWTPITRKYYACYMHFLMPEIGASVEVYFSYGKLPLWEKVRHKTELFLLDHIKN
ncbi:hypothetical protein AB7Y92_06490 [Providencia manganoxydans]|uniref:hypothetical protein n=1 Tax=Providencia manganoxydans TaxID=2923283 RepID=UPI0034E51387